MPKLVEMDERAPIFAQMEEQDGPVILINKFSVDPAEFDQFLKGWAAEAQRFKEQPGFISTQTTQGYWREWHLCQLCGLGICCTFQEGS